MSQTQCTPMRLLVVSVLLIAQVQAVPQMGHIEPVRAYVPTNSSTVAGADGAAEEEEARAHRALQQAGGGRPDKCSSEESYQTWLAAVNQACCAKAASACTNGMPSSCDAECADILTPMRKACKAKLQSSGLMDTITAAAHTCPHTSSSSRGCPKTIPSLDPGQQDCGSGSGFWPIGSVCTSSCSAPNGGGHRRAQAGGTASYICTQGGNWVSPTPLDCTGASGAAGSGNAGRFVAITQPMSIADATIHCRQNYASLASIHSWSEQQEAVTACEAMRGQNHDQASYGGCEDPFSSASAPPHVSDSGGAAVRRLLDRLRGQRIRRRLRLDRRLPGQLRPLRSG